MSPSYANAFEDKFGSARVLFHPSEDTQECFEVIGWILDHHEMIYYLIDVDVIQMDHRPTPMNVLKLYGCAFAAYLKHVQMVNLD
jgi:hypothetical protein